MGQNGLYIFHTGSVKYITGNFTIFIDIGNYRPINSYINVSILPI